ncbi:TetR/AcrR family transcriptional regulator [Yinghuangia aomiensis]
MARMKRVSAEQRRSDLVQAAIEVMSRDGFERATTRRIAEHAGASQAAFHYAFRDKDELLAAVVDELTARLEPFLSAAVDVSRGPEAALADSLRALWTQVFQDDGYQLMQYELVLHCLRSPGQQHLARRVYDRYLAMVTGLVDAACQATGRTVAPGAEALARFAVAHAEGAVLRYEVTRDRGAAEADLDLALRALAVLASGP